MKSEAIRDQFYKIADYAINPDVAMLIRQLGDLMYAQFQITSASTNAINAAIQELKKEHTERTQAIIDRIHNLSNRFMAVENKADETVELLDLKLEEILAAVAGRNDDNERSTTN